MWFKVPSTWRHFWLGCLLFSLVVSCVAIALFRLSKPAVAQVSLFYPETCLGGWRQPQAAAGLPDAEEGETRQGLSVYEDNGSSIFCGEFAGELPPQTYHTRVTLRFDWHQANKDPVILEDDVTDGGTTESPDTVYEVIEDSTIGDIASSTSETATDLATGTVSQGESDLEPVSDPIVSEQTEGTTTTPDNVEVSTSTTNATDAEVEAESTNPTVEVGEIESSLIPESPEGPEETEDVSEPDPVPDTISEPAPEASIEANTDESSHEAVSFGNHWLQYLMPTAYAETTATSSDDQIVATPVVPETIEEPETIVLPDVSDEMATNTVETSVIQSETVATNSVVNLPAETIFAVQYTLDGAVWETLGYVTTIDSDVRFEFPKEVFKTISDISRIQIALVPQLTVDEVLTVYLDAMWFEVGYAPVRELGVHTVSAIVPSVVPFSALIDVANTDVVVPISESTTTIAGIEASTTATIVDEVVVPVFSETEFTEAIRSVHGIDTRYVVTTVGVTATTTEVWLFDMREERIHRIGVGEATIGQHPVGVKDNMVFWLNYLDEVIFVYDLRTAGQLHEMALVGNLPSANEYRLTFPFTDWEVIWRSDRFYFYTKETGEVFQDENTTAAQLFYDFFTLEQTLPNVKLHEIGGIVIPDEEQF